MTIRIVPDTNVILASHLSNDQESANKAVLSLWENGDIDLLYSADTILEYAEKLIALKIDTDQAEWFLAALIQAGDFIEIEHFHLHHYPTDSDDIAFLLCADNGNATDLITYDHHLSDLNGHFPFHIYSPRSFLRRIKQEKPSPESPRR